MSDPAVRENSQYYSPTFGSSGKQNEKSQNGFIEDTGKKKQKKWSIGGLFRKKRNKSSDTDSSSEVEDKRRGFLGRRKGGHRKGGSHKVVGKFERIVIPRNEPEQTTNSSSACMLNKLERYDTSPNANRRHRSVTSNNATKSNQEINDSNKSFESGSYGSLDTAAKRNERQKLKARVEAKRGQLVDESSSDEYESSKNSNSSSLQRIQSDENVMKYGSSSRRSRAARTDRYIRRNFKDDTGTKNKEGDSHRSSGLSINSLPIKGSDTSRKSKWTAKVVYQESNDYSCQFTAKAQSATSSPLNSPYLKAKGIGNQSASLPSRITLIGEDSAHKGKPFENKAACNNKYINVQDLLDQLDEQNQRNMKSLEKLGSDIPNNKKSPPPPPPRNPNRRILPTHYSASALRPYSCSFGGDTYANNDTDALAHLERPVESCSYQLEEQIPRVYKENSVRNKYSTDTRPKSRTPIQMTSSSPESKSHSPSYNFEQNHSVLNGDQYFRDAENEMTEYTGDDIFFSSSSDRLDQMNEIGIPVYEEEYDPQLLGTPVKGGRPLSMVIEKSESEIAISDVEYKDCYKAITKTKNGKKEGKKSSNLEDALFELEEIYKSLRLSDEDLLDRADRREVTSAAQIKRQNSRYSWGGLNGYQSEPILYSGRRYSSVEYLPISEVCSSRSRSSRKSAIPDMVADDMAYRKLRKSDNHNVASTCNIVSRAGSFLLMSPTLSPQPFYRITTPTSPNEPDVTLDDVVFRNVRQSNNTLKVQDPQPPFGIPIGPITPAADSDYLHAKPENLYRSTFRPRRTPDVVKDDLAFRMLRKDVLSNNPSTEYTGRFIKADHFAHKKRRAVRSLSANIASLMEKGSRTPYVESQKHALDLNSNTLSKENRCTSFNNMPDILAQFGNNEGTCRTIPDIIRRQSPPRRTRDVSCSPELLKCDYEDKYLSLIANEAKQMTEELNIKLNNLRQEAENIPKKSNNETFVKKIVHHKPITLSQFNIQDVNKSYSYPQNDVPKSNLVNENVNKRDTKEWSDLFNERKKAFTSHLNIQLRRSPEKIYITSNKNCEEFVKDAERKNENSEIDSYESCSTIKKMNENLEDKENLKKGNLDDIEIISDKKCDLNSEKWNLKKIPGNSSTSENGISKYKLSFSDEINSKNNYTRKSNNNNNSRKDGNFLKNLCVQETSMKNDDSSSCIGNCFPSEVVQNNEVTMYYNNDDIKMTEQTAGNKRGNNIMDVSDVDNRQKRIARYKEERRRQLNNQFPTVVSSNVSHSTSNNNNNNYHYNLRPRFESKVTSNSNKGSSNEQSSAAPIKSSNKNKTRIKSSATIILGKCDNNNVESSSLKLNEKSKQERDKSSKRKSYLNRSLNAERIVNNDFTEYGYGNCRNSFITTNRHDAGLGSPIVSSSDKSGLSSSLKENLYNYSPSPSSKIITSKAENRNTVPDSSTPIVTSSSENGRRLINDNLHNSNIPRRVMSPSSLNKNSYVKKTSEKEMEGSKIPRRVFSPSQSSFNLQQVQPVTLSDSEIKPFANVIDFKLESGSLSDSRDTRNSITNNNNLNTHHNLLTRDDNKKSSLLRIIKDFSSNNSTINNKNVTETGKNSEIDDNLKKSILKKRSSISSSGDEQYQKLFPILKRKDLLSEIDNVTTTNTPSQGILKKYSSFDESDKSCSSDIEAGEVRPILKSQLIEVTPTTKSLTEPQSILKRKASYVEDHLQDYSSTTEPQSILKRKTSDPKSSEISSDTIFIEMEGENIKPILKNRLTLSPVLQKDSYVFEIPKPILKKKGDEEIDKPKPILKMCKRRSLDESTSRGANKILYSALKRHSFNNNGDDMKSILKYSENEELKIDNFLDNLVRNNESSENKENLEKVTLRTRIPNAIKERPVSVAERITNLEQFFKHEVISKSTSLVPSVKSKHARDNPRYKTQPITLSEIKSTDSLFKMESDIAVKRIIDDSSLSQEKPKNKTTLDEEILTSLRRSNSVSKKSSLFSKLNKDTSSEDEMAKRKLDGKTHRDRKTRTLLNGNNNRFVTQPITTDEIIEAKRQNISTPENKENKETSGDDENSDDVKEPTNLSIAERVKLIRGKIDEQNRTTAIRHAGSRFKTQPITTEEVRKARDGSQSPSVIIEEENSDLKEDESIFEANDKENSKYLKEEEGSFKKNGLGLNTDILITSSSDGDTSSSGGREIQSILKKRSSSFRHYTNRDDKMNVIGKDMIKEKAGYSLKRSSTIAERLAALQKSGQVDWKKRVSRSDSEKVVSKNIVNGAHGMLATAIMNGHMKQTNLLQEQQPKSLNITESDIVRDSSLLADRLGQLETSSLDWKKRVESSDALQFTSYGRLPSNGPRIKRTPLPSTFKSKAQNSSKDEIDKESQSTVEPTKLPNPIQNRIQGVNKTKRIELPIVGNVISVPDIFDDDFTTFFGDIEKSKTVGNLEKMDIDLSEISINQNRLLSNQKRSVRIQRKHASARNPIKALAKRTDVKQQYEEIRTNIAEQEIKRINVEKLSKGSTLAVEALAGLASNEDFSSVVLKKPEILSPNFMAPYKSLMLLHIKGRRHVQTRLVEPVVNSINSGDCYILITPYEIFHWIGQYSNVIEVAKGIELAQNILLTHDLGCVFAKDVITIDHSKSSKIQKNEFWKLIGNDDEVEENVAGEGDVDEDDDYEAALISTNMIYEVTDNELVPVKKYWGSVPKVEMLHADKVFVFDFGTECYVWLGKNVDSKRRKSSIALAEELWKEGYNYDQCDICPINSFKFIGNRSKDEDKIEKSGKERPSWCLLGKITQHMETALFKAKFADWLNPASIITVKGLESDNDKQQVDVTLDIKPCDVKDMVQWKPIEANLKLEGSSLGRGQTYYDEQGNNKFQIINTLGIRIWHIGTENESTELPESSFGQLHTGDSYIIRWLYSITQAGRGLSGQPSRHSVKGRDRCAYFCWHGKEASVNEKGTAALLTVELDKEKGPQMTLFQGYEIPAFFNLFKGRTVIYKDKRGSPIGEKYRLFMCRGEVESEASLVEVSCEVNQLRSRTSFLLVNRKTGHCYIWHGNKSSSITRSVCVSIVNNLKENMPEEMSLQKDVCVEVEEIEENEEPDWFLKCLGVVERSTVEPATHDKNLALFHLSSVTGTFSALPIIHACQHHQFITPYPFLQQDLYSASQPALFLLDTGYELWLWQGWRSEEDVLAETEQSIELSQCKIGNYKGSSTARWQLERRSAMQTALDYWDSKYKDKEKKKAYLIWAGLEPSEFINLFPHWTPREDVANLNLKDGRKKGEMLSIEEELNRLTYTLYTPEELLQKPLPDGVDPTRLELYLKPEHFPEILSMTKDDFFSLPLWKQTAVKKSVGLF